MIPTTNEPLRIDCGGPDYIFRRKNNPIGYIEVMDLDVDLKCKTLK